MSAATLVDIRGLTVEYRSSAGLLGRRTQRTRVLEDFTLQLERGKTLGVVGESGCGKSTLANSMMRFVEPIAGQILFEGRDVLAMDRRELRGQRRQMQIVFQNPFSSLNPRLRVKTIVAEPLITHLDLTSAQLDARIIELLSEVGLGGEFMLRFPHELSGGQAQRVALARALALNPKLLILDEPTSALDVSVQAQIVNLLGKLQRDHQLTYLFISHSLALVQHISDYIAVLYLGEVVEYGRQEDITRSPQHPYTRALFSSTPLPDPDSGRERIILEGTVPSPKNPPGGCRFHTRCPQVMERCRTQKPPAHATSDGHWATCHLLDEAVGPGVRKNAS